ncbi:MAG: ABC transporter permease [Gemmatimonadaceae bacterium]|jgi:predicted permease|nr:ABC transporter permease [Gemmatimonadaceae bacterium]
MIDDPLRLWRRVRHLLSRRRHDAELAEEMATHHALRQRDFERDGLTPDAARHAASRVLGNQTLAAEDARAVWWATWAESAWQDVRYGLRVLRRAPAFMLVAVFGLAGGIGVCAALFSGFNALALRGFDVFEPDRLASVFTADCVDCEQPNSTGWSMAEIAYVGARARTISGLMIDDQARPDESGALSAAMVSANYFTLLGVPMVRGRPFAAGEDDLQSPTAVIVLSDRVWRERHGARDDIVGQSVRLRGVPFTVIGVAAAAFRGTSALATDAWIPVAARRLVTPNDPWVKGLATDPQQCCMQVVARLADGVSRQAAATELTALRAQVPRTRPDSSRRIVALTPFTVVGSKGPASVRRMASTFGMIGAGVGILLLLACANVANLLLARASVRQREIRLRLALGASRARVVRQLLTEGVLLAGLASLGALVIARLLPPLVLRVVTTGTLALDFSVDHRVLLATIAVASFSVMLFALAPALQATRPLIDRGPRTALRGVFLSAQVAFSLVLLVTAGLFVRSVQAGRTIAPGVAVSALDEVAVTLPATVTDSVEVRRWHTRLPELARDVGIRRSALAGDAPLRFGATRYRRVGDPAIHEVPSTAVGVGYFDVVGQRVTRGRDRAEGTGGLRELLVNDSLAAELGGAERAIGQTLVIDSVSHTIVGVVTNARDATLRNAVPVLYRTLSPLSVPRLVIRDDQGGATRLQRAIRAAESQVDVAQRAYQWYLDDALRESQGAATMAGLLGGMSLLLAALGMFGVVAYWVQQRRREIGIRVALGATRRHVTALVLGSTSRAVVSGVVVGTAGAIAAGRVVRGALFGVEPVTAPTFLLAIGVLMTAAALATVYPCWLALRIDPAESLRAD